MMKIRPEDKSYILQREEEKNRLLCNLLFFIAPSLEPKDISEESLDILKDGIYSIMRQHFHKEPCCPICIQLEDQEDPVPCYIYKIEHSICKKESCPFYEIK